MKALKVVMTTVLTMALLGSQVLAAGTGSPLVGNGPKVKKASLASGTDVTGMIVTTYMSEAATTPYEEVKNSLNSAATDFKAAGEKPKALKDASGATLEAKIKAAAEKQVSGINVDDLKASEIFDTSYIEEGKVKKLGESITITYEYSIAADSAVVVIHQTASGVWEVVDAKISGNEITVTTDGLSPFAFLVGKKSASENKGGSEGDGKKSAQTGEYVTEAVLVGAAVLMLGGLVCVTMAKKKNSAK